VPGRAKRHDLLDAAFLGGTAAHGIELDDGYRVGSAHCGCTVVPAALSVGYERAISGAQLIEAVVAGYEVAICLAARLRARPAPARLPSDQRGRPVRRAVAVAKLRGLSAQQIADALGIAASAPPGCSPSSTAAPTSSACTRATPRARASRRACLAQLGVQGRPT
jgi:2-methylcitrate dehydratase PrpD